MDARLKRLEDRVDELTSAVRDLQRQMASMVPPVHGRRDADAPDGRETEVANPHGLQELTGRIFVLVGRSCVVLGGAFLIRALTDAGALPSEVGVAAGLLYALAWMGFAYRDGVRGRTLSAAFHGIVATAIAYTLVWEATVRFAFIAPAAAAAALAVIATAGVVVATSAGVRALAWTVAVGTAAAGLPMLVTTRSVVAFGALLLGVGAATAWLAYARHWHTMRWPAAVVADVVVLQATLIAARPGGPRPPYDGVSPGAVVVLAVSLFVVYVGSFALRVLMRHRDVNAFEVAQSVATLVVGFGGAVRVVRAMGGDTLLPGTAALVLAVASYAVAFAFVERRHGAGRSFLFFAYLGLALVVVGSELAFGTIRSAAVESVCAAAAAAVAWRYDRLTLRIHAAVLLLAGAVTSGLVAWTGDVFTAGPGAAWRPFPSVAAVVLASAVVTAVLLVQGARPDREVWFARLPRLVAAFVAVAGIAAVAMTGVLAALRTGVATADSGSLAAVRSAVLAVAAVALAAGGTRAKWAELGWLVYPVLAVGGAKLLFDDVAHGRATTLVPALVLYGIALIVAPGLLRRRRTAR